MLIKDDSNSNDFEPTKAGLHPAVCYGLIDVGTHEESFQGEPKLRRIVFILFELPTLTLEIDGVTKPRGINQKYTMSMHKKANLRRDIESWRGKPFLEHEAQSGFELKSILGANCQLNVIHNISGDKTYANISSIVPLGHGMKKHDNFNELICYEISDGVPIPDGVPRWLQSKILASMELNETGQRGQSGNRIVGPDVNPWDDSEPLQEPEGGMMRQPGDEDSNDVPF